MLYDHPNASLSVEFGKSGFLTRSTRGSGAVAALRTVNEPLDTNFCPPHTLNARRLLVDYGIQVLAS